MRATYDLEGDGPLLFSAFRQLQEVLTACSLQHYPNISAVAKQLMEEDPELDLQELRSNGQKIAYVLACSCLCSSSMSNIEQL